MTRAFGIAAFAALTGLGWFFFELSNIWPFNADRVSALRAVFAIFALAAACSFLLARWRLLPPMFLLAAFVVTSALSKATFSVGYLVTAGVIVSLSALLSLLYRPPLNFR
jgi:hypothetical protein